MRGCVHPSVNSWPPLLVFADDWGRHASSCQHLIRRLRQDFPVIWANSIGTRQVKADSITLRRAVEKINSWRHGLKQVDERMWVIDLPMLPTLGNRFLGQINQGLVTARLKSVLSSLGLSRPIVLTTLPYIPALIANLKRRGLIYYCTDDYSYWPSADREALQKADRELSRSADLILAASQALYEDHAPLGRCQYFPHGVDFAHFALAMRPTALPDEIARLPEPRIGFFGLVYEKLDFALLTAVAERFRQGSLVMIGPVAFCPPEFARLPNVHLLGARPYEELPRHIAGLDVLLLPYVAGDEMIRRSGPLKLRECLASGKPTVSVDVPDVRALQPYVRIGKDRADYLEQIRLALQEGRNPSLATARQQAVKQDSWDARAEQLSGLLAPLQARAPAPSPPPARARKNLRRVLHLRTVTGWGGGPEKTLLNSPRFLQDSYQLRLVYFRPSADDKYDMPQRAARMGVDLVDIPETGAIDPRALWRLIHEIRTFQPDILHAHDFKTNMLAVLLGRFFRLPILTTVHGYVTRGGRLEFYYWLDRWALRRMDHVIAVSGDLSQLLANLGIPPRRSSLVENGVDTDQYRRRRSVSEAKERIGLALGRFTIGTVGRLSAEKGFDLLIRAADQLLRSGLPLDLLIVGEGDERPRLEALIAQLGRKDHFHLLGYRPDPVEVLEALDLFALSSLREGLPNALLEAMALEVPVVATRIAGIPRLIRDGENGLLVEPGDEKSLAAALSRLLEDAALRAELGRTARRTIETSYSFEGRMRKIRALYDDLTNSST